MATIIIIISIFFRHTRKTSFLSAGKKDQGAQIKGGGLADSGNARIKTFIFYWCLPLDNRGMRKGLIFSLHKSAFVRFVFCLFWIMIWHLCQLISLWNTFGGIKKGLIFSLHKSTDVRFVFCLFFLYQQKPDACIIPISYSRYLWI